MATLLLAPSHVLSISDGDTPEVRMGLRMLGIDAPELHFPQGKSPASQDSILQSLPKTAAYANLPSGLRDHLKGRLEGAGTRQEAWGLKAKAAFEGIVKDGLHGKDGKRRPLFLACGPAVFDRYGRILAYAGPYVPRAERNGSAPPDTFNLRMLNLGMAAPCLHDTNLPKESDLELAGAAVQAARGGKLGFWKEADLILHGYEFRALCRLAAGEEGFTYPTADLRTAQAVVLPAVEYYQIPEEYRVFKDGGK